MTAIPQEIYDEIIDHLHGNKADLATCALVCRAWIPSSRYHLFSVVHIAIDEYRFIMPYRRRVVRFLDLLTLSEYVLPSIREVRILFKGPGESLEKHCLTDVLTILRDAAPRFQSVSFSYSESGYYSPLNLREILPLHRLTAFSLACGYNRQDLALCAAMPCLRELVIDATSRFEPFGDFIEGKVLLPQLRKLTFYGRGTEILHSLAPPPLLRDLTLKVRLYAKILSVGAFLQPLAHNIERLTLVSSNGASMNDHFMQKLGLRHMTHLRSLIIRLDATEHESVPAALDSVTSCEVDRIEFFLDLSSWARFTGDHWIGVPAILEKPNFRSLRKLEFRLDGDTDMVTETEAWIIQQLQGLEARQILSITHARIYK